MAKRRQTAAQRKAKQRAAYYRREYYKNFDALAYLESAVKIKKINIPNKITKRSVEAIRKIYNKARKEAKELGWELPTKQEMAQTVREEPTQAYRQYRAEPEEPTEFDPDLQYLEELRDKLNSFTPRRDSTKTDANFQKNVLPKFEEARLRIIGALDYAITIGEEEIDFDKDEVLLIVKSMLKREMESIVYNTRIKDLEIESIDDDLIPLIEASVDEALDSI